MADAQDWLQEVLASGEVPAAQVHKLAKEEGISGATLRRAQKYLGIDPKKNGMADGWTWSLPKMLKNIEDAQA